ncbi:MAG: hypothetical protein RIQ89_454 [Bacteroidota bacterium]|jgi:tRNA threonylcarbamoyladenosine biosynthesis protein TsaE
MHVYEVNSLTDLATAAQALHHQLKLPLIYFYGSMGAGKTTLIKLLCQQWEVVDAVSSPTFAIVNEYLTAVGNTIYHFDFYRINHPSEAVELGVDEYFYSGNKCLLEWPEKIVNLLPHQAHRIFIDVVGQTRFIKLDP